MAKAPTTTTEPLPPQPTLVVTDDDAYRQTAFLIASNRSAASEDITANQRLIYGWIVPRYEEGHQCVIRANNSVYPQASITALIETATQFYADLTAGDGSPRVREAVPPLNMPEPPNPPVAAPQQQKK